jgi:pimeloyl-ACP methyl ester carboxylesterase
MDPWWHAAAVDKFFAVFRRVPAIATALRRTVQRSSQRSSADAPLPIETRYAAAGPWEYTTSPARDAEDRPLVVAHPVSLGAGGTRHPVAVWGNGTWAPLTKYTALLAHLASWGFVVAAPESNTLGDGVEIEAAARYLVAAGGDPASRFHGRLDTTRLAALGHSQGAGGSARAAVRTEGLITTVVPIALPSPGLVSEGHEYDMTALSVPVLLMGGEVDGIAPPGDLADYLRQVPGPGALLVLNGADHNGIQAVDGGGFLGYLTAWLRHHLCDDEEAAAAFAGPVPEAGRAGGRWSFRRRNI